MKISYERGVRKNFMIIDPEGLDWENYESGMILHNNIEGFLKMKMRPVAEGELFYYDITSRQPLSRMQKGTQWKAADLKNLMIQIDSLLREMESYLLKESRILLDPDYIYTEPETGRLYFAYVPGMERSFSEELGDLLEGLLECVDHRDKECVVLAYGLYQETRKENYGMEDLMRLIYSRPVPDDEEKAVSSYREVLPEIISEMEPAPGEEKKTGLFETLKERVFSRFSKDNEPNGEENEDIWFGEAEVFDSEKNRMYEEAAAEYKEASGEFKESPAGYTQTAAEYREIPREVTGDTLILSELKAQIDLHILKALDPGAADIPISYYPFVIGKQENMVDHRLDDDTVSRLHLKISREDDRYLIEDLNSTNGTTLNGELLKNNEERGIVPGDEIGIARLRFRFE